MKEMSSQCRLLWRISSATTCRKRHGIPIRLGYIGGLWPYSGISDSFVYPWENAGLGATVAKMATKLDKYFMFSGIGVDS